MAVKNIALEYCKAKKLFEMSDIQKDSICEEVFFNLRNKRTNYEENKKLLSKLRGE